MARDAPQPTHLSQSATRTLPPLPPLPPDLLKFVVQYEQTSLIFCNKDSSIPFLRTTCSSTGIAPFFGAGGPLSCTFRDIVVDGTLFRGIVGTTSCVGDISSGKRGSRTSGEQDAVQDGDFRSKTHATRPRGTAPSPRPQYYLPDCRLPSYRVVGPCKRQCQLSLPLPTAPSASCA